MYSACTGLRAGLGGCLRSASREREMESKGIQQVPLRDPTTGLLKSTHRTSSLCCAASWERGSQSSSCSTRSYSCGMCELARVRQPRARRRARHAHLSMSPANMSWPNTARGSRTSNRRSVSVPPGPAGARRCAGCSAPSRSAHHTRPGGTRSARTMFASSVLRSAMHCAARQRPLAHACVKRPAHPVSVVVAPEPGTVRKYAAKHARGRALRARRAQPCGRAAEVAHRAEAERADDVVAVHDARHEPRSARAERGRRDARRAEREHAHAPAGRKAGGGHGQAGRGVRPALRAISRAAEAWWCGAPVRAGSRRPRRVSARRGLGLQMRTHTVSSISIDRAGRAP
jgi:hypothetical protein